MKTLIRNVVWGAAVTAATLLVVYQYCMDGPGRGLLFAVYTPVCGAWFLILKLDNSKIPQVIDCGALIANILFWSLVVGLPRFLIHKYRNNQSPAQ